MEKSPYQQAVECSAEGCQLSIICRGYCKKHYDSLRRNGEPLLAGLRVPKNYIKDGVGHIELKSGDYALVDSDKFELASRNLWHKDAWGYPAARINKKLVRLHQLVFGKIRFIKNQKFYVDHRDRDKLNNTSVNLRWATQQQNTRNSPSRRGSSVYKGVTWDKQKGKWMAQISIGGAHKFLGYFCHEKDAATRYNSECLILDPIFSYTNKV